MMELAFRRMVAMVQSSGKSQSLRGPLAGGRFVYGRYPTNLRASALCTKAERLSFQCPDDRIGREICHRQLAWGSDQEQPPIFGDALLMHHLVPSESLASSLLASAGQPPALLLRRLCDSATKSVTSLTVIVFEIVLRENTDREEARHRRVTLIFCSTGLLVNALRVTTSTPIFSFGRKIANAPSTSSRLARN
jgi:hypothetical protein